MSRIIQFQGQRAAEAHLDNVQLNIDPIVTDLVLGQPGPGEMPGARILKPVTTSAWNFQYRQNDLNRLKRYDTERGMRQPIKTGDFRYSMVSASLKRFSFGTLRDVDELLNAHPSLGLREACGRFSKTIVDMDLERRRRDLLVTAGNYDSGNTLAISAGSEWNSAGGDSKSDVRSMLAVISGKTGLRYNQISVFLSDTSLQAALEDPIFNATRSNWTADTADEQALQRYWGSGPVWSMNPVEADDDGVVSPMYGDVAILYYNSGVAGVDTMDGDLTFGCDFRYNGGVASKPFYNDLVTSWMFPWTAYDYPAITTNFSGALITNCAA